MSLPRRWIAPVLIAALSGCAGGGSLAPAPAATATPASVVVPLSATWTEPGTFSAGPIPATTISFPGGGPAPGFTLGATVTLTGGAPPYTAHVGTNCGNSSPSVTVSSLGPTQILVNYLAPGIGLCTVTFADSSSPALTYVSTVSAPTVCNLPLLPVLYQAYPLPGATGVATSTATAIVISSLALPPSWGVALTAGTTTLAGGALTTPPSPLPSPIAALPPGGYAYYAAALPALAAATTYQFVVTTPFTGVCSYQPTLGTFTTSS